MMKKVIIITDGDNVARRSVEFCAREIGGRCISLSAGNPSHIDSDTLISYINEAPLEPVLVMVDDKGSRGYGRGEENLIHLLINDDIEVIGIVAVASNTFSGSPIKVDVSVTKNLKISDKAVDKYGNEQKDKNFYGDTINVIEQFKVRPIIVGIGDVGKMHGKDDISLGSPVLMKAVRYILDKHKKVL
ncbi:stage V sporulation protein AE [Clostridium bornimense]|nr:stage V sporulation protein AE [Clostridium bornimense]